MPKPVAKPPAVRPTAGRNGIASWFDSYGPGLYAAVNSYRWGQPRYRMTVCTATRCVRVTVRDFCACGHGRIVDLSRDAFAVLASPSRGLLRVRVVGLR